MNIEMTQEEIKDEISKLAPVYKAIMMAYQYQINCELTPEQCKILIDYFEKPIIVKDES